MLLTVPADKTILRIARICVVVPLGSDYLPCTSNRLDDKLKRASRDLISK